MFRWWVGGCRARRGVAGRSWLRPARLRRWGARVDADVGTGRCGSGSRRVRQSDVAGGNSHRSGPAAVQEPARSANRQRRRAGGARLMFQGCTHGTARGCGAQHGAGQGTGSWLTPRGCARSATPSCSPVCPTAPRSAYRMGPPPPPPGAPGRRPHRSGRPRRRRRDRPRRGRHRCGGCRAPPSTRRSSRAGWRHRTPRPTAEASPTCSNGPSHSVGVSAGVWPPNRGAPTPRSADPCAAKRRRCQLRARRGRRALPRPRPGRGLTVALHGNGSEQRPGSGRWPARGHAVAALPRARCTQPFGRAMQAGP